jgi:hypothetical protein
MKINSKFCTNDMLQTLSDFEIFHIKSSQIISYLSAKIIYVEIRGSHSGKYEDYYRVKCDSLKSCIPLPKVWKILLHLFSGYKGRNMEETVFSVSLVQLYQNTWRHIPEDSNLQNITCPFNIPISLYNNYSSLAVSNLLCILQKNIESFGSFRKCQDHT